MRPVLDPRDFTSADLQRAALLVVENWDRSVPPDRSDVAFGVVELVVPDWEPGAWPGERFAEKVGRALDRLVKRGDLMREKGVWQGRGFTAFFTPAQVSARVVDQLRAAAAAKAAEQRWVDVAERAAEEGIVVTSAGDGWDRAVISVDDLERLLGGPP